MEIKKTVVYLSHQTKQQNKNKQNTMQIQKQFKIGQRVTYTQCASTYTGEIVKIKDKTLIIIDDNDGMILWNMGYAVGDEISFNQVK